MGALTSLATLGLELALAHRAREDRKDRFEDHKRAEIRRIEAAEAEERRREQAALARRLAQERARAGALGISAAGGSFDAVLRGLEEESRALRAARDRETRARIELVRARHAARGRRSLLDDAPSRLLRVAPDLFGTELGTRRSLLE
ncbi:MAG: hypothetical protein NZ704_05970 [Geminicoccaceae bacterium]|nr:hypothetical protein [Geminicoccaceae bacterium]